MSINKVKELIEAEKKAADLFQTIELRKLIRPGITEKELNKAVYSLAFELYGIKKFWHKRIVRSGKNTLLPYSENPPDLVLQNDDILFLDFGPVFDEWEADYGRTYVIGEDAKKNQLKADIEKAWQEGKEYFLKHQENIIGAEFYAYTKDLAKKYGWDYGNEHCGHLIGNFPHEQIEGEETINYIHPDNHLKMHRKGKDGQLLHWIYEIHFVDEKEKIGGFYEQLMV
jgi:Xaa-Pro aminopeptidase